MPAGRKSGTKRAKKNPRRASKSNRWAPEVSSEHYLGYVEDGETPEMIMKKFEQLNKFETKIRTTQQKTEDGDDEKENTADGGDAAAATATSTTAAKGVDGDGSLSSSLSPSSEPSSPSALDDNDSEGFSSMQLQQIFKLTSSFNVNALKNAAYYNEKLDFQFEDVDDADAEEESWFEEEIYDDDEWLTTGNLSKRKKRRRTGGGRAKRDKKSKSESGKTHKYVAMQVVSNEGYIYTVRKKIRSVDPNLPTYTRLPMPMPRSWARRIRPFVSARTYNTVPPSSTYHEVTSIVDMNLDTTGQDFLAALIDPPWKEMDFPSTASSSSSSSPSPSSPSTTQASPSPQLSSTTTTSSASSSSSSSSSTTIPSTPRVTPKDLARLKLSDDLIPCGLIFMWVEKEYIFDACQVMQQAGFNYIENFVWVRMNVNNTIADAPYPYFRKSKRSLIMFRKDSPTRLELRHQRTPDVDFHTITADKGFNEDKPDFVYQLIETLLPHARFNPEKPDAKPKLLELWAKKEHRRKGWTTVAETSQPKPPAWSVMTVVNPATRV
eukprot:TRINITY_DN2214_c0_g2_i1.p1 TRINITY_DN2214_c0_g2~~TRINITY_DN2214_c0_g2_i1.p1  ORF type:complete len:559 (+),score=183.67 TRINITY_DN2214_c0_g2_i1:33-1679(+)